MLRARLEEAEETLRAIGNGEVDALVIGEQVYTLESADAASNRFRGEALAQINEVVIAVDNEYCVTYLNPAAEKQYVLDASEVLGRRLDELYTSRWVEAEDETASFEALTTKGYWRGENIHIRRDGEEIRVESSVNRLRDRSGAPAGYLAVISDIRERKQAEQALLKAHDELELRVRERTKELADANASLQREMHERAAAERERSELLQRVVTVQEEERRRIAREIHDQLGQRVTALRFQIASLSNQLKHLESSAQSLASLDETASKLDTEVSFLVWELRPASLDDLGLKEAARSLVDEWSRHHGISAEFDAAAFKDDRLPPHAETHLYRILQEALNNIVKHASAKMVDVLLRWDNGQVLLIVEDDGVGFDMATLENHPDTPTGLGLVGMRERAILSGGDVVVESGPGNGTTINVRIPILRTEESRAT